MAGRFLGILDFGRPEYKLFDINYLWYAFISAKINCGVGFGERTLHVVRSPIVRQVRQSLIYQIM